MEGKKENISKIIKSLLTEFKNMYLQRRAFNLLEFCLFICFVFFHYIESFIRAVMPHLLATCSTNAVKTNFSGSQGGFRKHHAHLNFLQVFAMRKSCSKKRVLVLLLLLVLYFEWRKVILAD